MAYEVAGAGSFCFTWEAGVTLATYQFKFVKLNALGKIVPCDADGEMALGVLQDNPVLGQPGNVMLHGISKVVVAVSEVIAAGDAIGTTVAGTATTVTPSGAPDLNDFMMGQMLEAVTGSNPASVLGTLLLRPFGRAGIA